MGVGSFRVSFFVHKIKIIHHFYFNGEYPQ
nr:MAG TPA: hypothetical protein [Caudoviricetes sp.]